MSPFCGAHTTYFLFTFPSKCLSILYRFRGAASYLSKVANFSTPRVSDDPVGGDRIGISSRPLASEN